MTGVTYDRRCAMAKILIVDNNEHIAEMFSEVLTGVGHKVTVIADGLKAIDSLNHNNYDIAFIDLELPDINGLDILRSIQANSPQTVSSIISGKSDINYAIEAIKAGVFRYLKKPFDIEDILGVTKLACEKRGLRDKSDRLKFILNIFNKLNRKKVLKPVLDLPLLIIGLALGFIVQQQVFAWREIPIIWGVKEMLYVVVSFVCCYGFVYMRSMMVDQDLPSQPTPKYDLKIQTMTYVVFAAILYFFSDFFYGRLILVTGFILGLAGLWINRNFLYPALQRLTSKHQEGPRKLVFKGLGQSSPEIIEEKDKIDNAPVLKSEDFHEISGSSAPRYSGPSAADDWGSRLIDEFRKNRVKRDTQLPARQGEEVTV